MNQLVGHTASFGHELCTMFTQSHLLQDLDSMRQDLATYASDLKVEQDHAVRSLPLEALTMQKLD